MILQLVVALVIALAGCAICGLAIYREKKGNTRYLNTILTTGVLIAVVGIISTIIVLLSLAWSGIKFFWG